MKTSTLDLLLQILNLNPVANGNLAKWSKWFIPRQSDMKTGIVIQMPQTAFPSIRDAKYQQDSKKKKPKGNRRWLKTLPFPEKERNKRKEKSKPGLFA